MTSTDYDATRGTVQDIHTEAPSDPAWSKNQGMYGTFMRENREIPRPPIRVISGRDAQGTPRR